MNRKRTAPFHTCLRLCTAELEGFPCGRAIGHSIDPVQFDDAYAAPYLTTCQRQCQMIARRQYSEDTVFQVSHSPASQRQAAQSVANHAASSQATRHRTYLRTSSALINPRHQAKIPLLHHQFKPKQHPRLHLHHGRQSRHQPLPLHHPHRARIPPRLRCRQPASIPIDNGPTTRKDTFAPLFPMLDLSF